MLNAFRILVTASCRRLAITTVVGCALAGCGQKGDLMLPTGPAAAGRATLPETLRPGVFPAAPAAPAASAPPATGTAAPVRTP